MPANYFDALAKRRAYVPSDRTASRPLALRVRAQSTDPVIAVTPTTTPGEN